MITRQLYLLATGDIAVLLSVQEDYEGLLLDDSKEIDSTTGRSARAPCIP